VRTLVALIAELLACCSPTKLPELKEYVEHCFVASTAYADGVSPLSCCAGCLLVVLS